MAEKNGMSVKAFKEAYANGMPLITTVSKHELVNRLVKRHPVQRSASRPLEQAQAPQKKESLWRRVYNGAKKLFGGEKSEGEKKPDLGRPIYQEYKGAKDNPNFENSNVRYIIPHNAPGLTVFGGRNDDHWASEGMAKWLDATIKSWVQQGYKNSPIAINDISRPGGGKMSPHTTHKEGNHIDVKWQATDGKVYDSGRSNKYMNKKYRVKKSPKDKTYNNSHYDFEKNKQMIQTFLDNIPEGYKVTQILFGDEDLINYFQEKYKSDKRYYYYKGKEKKSRFEVRDNHGGHFHIGLSYDGG